MTGLGLGLGLAWVWPGSGLGVEIYIYKACAKHASAYGRKCNSLKPRKVDSVFIKSGPKATDRSYFVVPAVLLVLGVARGENARGRCAEECGVNWATAASRAVIAQCIAHASLPVSGHAWEVKSVGVGVHRQQPRIYY